MTDDTFTISDAVLEIFRGYGVENIFSSPGSEWAPLWEALAKAKALGTGPAYVNTRHESLAVSLASGYYYPSGKLSVVLLHASVGVAHAAMELRSANRERTPMVVMAGDTAGYGGMDAPDPGQQWPRVLSDAGGPTALARPLVKWSHTVPSREALFGVLQDACRLALTPPLGPVFLSVPMEFLVGDLPPFDRHFAPPPTATHADPAALEELAQQLVDARRPVVLSEYAGRAPENTRLLVELAENLAVPVMEARTPLFMNFPRDHELHQGFDNPQLLAEADLVLLVGNQNPWYPPAQRPTDAKIIAIDDDVAHELMAYWAFGVDKVIAGDLTNSLRQLNAMTALLKSGSACSESVREERREVYRQQHAKSAEEARARALAAAQKRPMNADWATRVIGEVLPQNALIIEETITHKAPILRQTRRNEPGTFHTRSTGGLGTGLGAALGFKFAEPERPVAILIGDGAFNYNPIPAAFGFAQQFRVPILVVVMNNQGYAAMKNSLVEYYPDGWSARTNTYYGSEIDPRPDYVALTQAFGGYGERVDDPEALSEAIRRALGRIESGQMALLDVTLAPKV